MKTRVAGTAIGRARALTLKPARFLGLFFKNGKRVQVADLLLAASAKYLMDFYDIPKASVHIVTLDVPLREGIAKVVELPNAYDPTIKAIEQRLCSSSGSNQTPGSDRQGRLARSVRRRRFSNRREAPGLKRGLRHTPSPTVTNKRSGVPENAGARQRHEPAAASHASFNVIYVMRTICESLGSSPLARTATSPRANGLRALPSLRSLSGRSGGRRKPR
jgi:hypothetical protein